MASNRDVIAMLYELAQLTTLEEGSQQSFKVRAYETALHAIEGTSGEIGGWTQKELEAIKGIGPSIAKKIREYVDTGTIDKLEELRAKYPPEFLELTRIPGLGPKTLATIRDRLGVETVEDLKAAIAGQRLRELPGLGATSEEKIAKAIDRLGLHGKDRRTPLIDALPIAEALVEALKRVEGVTAAVPCGSLRRFSDTVGDIDIVVATADAPVLMQTVVALPVVAEMLMAGDTKTSFLTRNGLQVDVRAIRPDQLGAASLYFTGSKAHNIVLRQLAIDRGYLLNEYGLLDGEHVVAATTEESIYAALELTFIPPELRENTGEIEAAAGGGLPDMVEIGHIKGDLHYHTDLSGDGRASLEEMVEAAHRRGYRYVAITDHGEDLAINGADRTQMLVHQHRIGRLAEKYPEMALLFGCELNIGPDGGLDYDPEFRLKFDWCVASIHSHFDLPVARQTERLLKAMADPSVNAIGHLSGRMIGRRPGAEFDVDAVLEGAAVSGVALEINGALDRLDATADVIRRATARGDVHLVISTDSHHPSEGVRMEYGVRQARRGWASKKQVVNTWPAARFLKWASHRRPEGVSGLA